MRNIACSDRSSARAATIQLVGGTHVFANNLLVASQLGAGGAFSVELTTNLVDWYLLGPATPRYLFTDTNAPALPQRYYRLRWP